MYNVPYCTAHRTVHCTLPRRCILHCNLTMYCTLPTLYSLQYSEHHIQYSVQNTFTGQYTLQCTLQCTVPYTVQSTGQCTIQSTMPCAHYSVCVCVRGRTRTSTCNSDLRIAKPLFFVEKQLRAVGYPTLLFNQWTLARKSILTPNPQSYYLFVVCCGHV